jgi:hypothetical protein
MSKKIWRGFHCDCTVVHDSACFPVREAMRLCKAAEGLNASNTDNYMVKWNRLASATEAYIKAVARMKAKKGSK